MVSRSKDFSFSIAISWRGLVVMSVLAGLTLLLTFGKDQLVFQLITGLRDWLIK